MASASLEVGDCGDSGPGAELMILHAVRPVCARVGNPNSGVTRAQRDAGTLDRVAGDRPVLVGLLWYVLVAVAPVVVFWVVLRLIPAAVSEVVDRRRRRALPPAPTTGSLVDDLHRLRREVRGPPPRTEVRRVAVLAAYDQVLLDVCHAVGLAEPPLACAVGGDRAFARLLTEAALEAAGIALDPPRRDGSAAV